jgi:hypothetical protein
MIRNVCKKLIMLALLVSAMFFTAVSAKAAESEINSATRELIGANITFPDLQYDDINAKAARWFAKNNIVSGYSDGTFQPTRYITRAEFAKLFCMTVGNEDKIYPPPETAAFTDVDISHWAAGYVSYMADAGLVTAGDDGCFYPDGYISYDEIFKLLLPLSGYDAGSSGDTPQARGKAAYTSGLTNSIDYSVLSNTDDFATRLLAVRLLYNTGVLPPPAILDDLSDHPFETYVTTPVKQCKVDTAAIPASCDVYFTLDGKETSEGPQLYESSFFVDSSVTISLVTVNRLTGRTSPASVFEYILPEVRQSDEIVSNIKENTSKIADALINPEMRERDRAIAVYRWINRNKNNKSSSLAEIWTGPVNMELESYGYSNYVGYGYGVIKCGTFAMAFRDLAQYAGLETDIVLGYSPDNERHAWNVVSINGLWYFVDAGWGFFGKTANTMQRLGYRFDEPYNSASDAYMNFSPFARDDLIVNPNLLIY